MAVTLCIRARVMLNSFRDFFLSLLPILEGARCEFRRLSQAVILTASMYLPHLFTMRKKRIERRAYLCVSAQY